MTSCMYVYLKVPEKHNPPPPSPHTNIMVRVELAGRDAATRRASSWLVSDDRCRGDVGRISVLPTYFEIIPYVMPKCLSTLMAF